MKEISIVDLLQLLWRRLWAVLLAALLCGTAAFTYCKTVAEEKYSATAAVMVTNGGLLNITPSTTTQSQSVKTSDLSASLAIADTVVDILKTPEIYKQLSKRINGEYSYSALMGMAHIARKSEESLFVNVTFTSSTSEESKRLANTFVNLAPDYVEQYIPYSYSKCTETADMSVRTAPRTFRTTVLFALAGAAVVYLIFFIAEQMNRAIESSEDFTTKFDIPLLGVVPVFEGVSVKKNKSKEDNKNGIK